MYVTQEINDLESAMDARTEEILSKLNRDIDHAVEEVIERLEMEPVNRSEAA